MKTCGFLLKGNPLGLRHYVGPQKLLNYVSVSIEGERSLLPSPYSYAALIKLADVTAAGSSWERGITVNKTEDKKGFQQSRQ